MGVGSGMFGPPLTKSEKRWIAFWFWRAVAFALIGVGAVAWFIWSHVSFSVTLT